MHPAPGHVCGSRVKGQRDRGGGGGGALVVQRYGGTRAPIVKHEKLDIGGSGEGSVRSGGARKRRRR